MTRLFDRVGFRSPALTFLAFVWLAVGARLLTASDPDPFHKLPIEYLPMQVRVLLWWLPAILAGIAAWVRVVPSRVGFVALVIPAAFRALSFTGAAATGLLTGDYPFWVAALVEAVVWAGVTGYVIVAAAWPDPPKGGQS